MKYFQGKACESDAKLQGKAGINGGCKISKRVYLWNVKHNRWGKQCIKMVYKYGLLVRLVHQVYER